VHYARLYAHSVLVDADHPPQMGREINHHPAPSDSPATPVPAPRAWIGRRFAAAYCTQAVTSAADRGQTTASGLIS